jgi:hypothetical protein
MYILLTCDILFCNKGQEAFLCSLICNYHIYLPKCSLFSQKEVPLHLITSTK